MRVYAVWYDMYPTDERSRWPGGLLTDARAAHRWDDGRLLGKWYWDELPRIQPLRAPESLVPDEGPMWDAYFLYDRDASWDERPSGLVSWGYTIMRTRAALVRDLNRLGAR